MAHLTVDECSSATGTMHPEIQRISTSCDRFITCIVRFVIAHTRRSTTPIGMSGGPSSPSAMRRTVTYGCLRTDHTYSAVGAPAQPVEKEEFEHANRLGVARGLALQGTIACGLAANTSS